MKSVIIGIVMLIVVVGSLFLATMDESSVSASRPKVVAPADNSYSNFKMN